MIELVGNEGAGACIKVIGVGGGGGNAVNTMIASALRGVEFIAANTDAQALAQQSRRGEDAAGRATEGLGAGANPEVGRSRRSRSTSSTIRELPDRRRHGVHHRRHGRRHGHRRRAGRRPHRARGRAR